MKHFAIGVLALLFATPADAHVFDHPEWDQWFESMMVPNEGIRPGNTPSRCCDKSDVYLLDDEDVRIVDDQYEARIDGKWMKFPDTGVGNPGNTVFGYVNNPTGGAVAWVFHGLPRCFAEGSGV